MIEKIIEDANGASDVGRVPVCGCGVSSFPDIQHCEPIFKRNPDMIRKTAFLAISPYI